MTQDLSPKEIQQLVEERALAIAKAAELPDVKAEEKLDPWFVIDRLRRNRVGDADLFVTLFRGRYAYVPEWDKWLYWSGHHWNIDLLSRRALADIEQVCAAYQNAIVETGTGRQTSPLSKTMRSRIDRLSHGCRSKKRCLSARHPSTIRRLLRPTILDRAALPSGDPFRRRRPAYRRMQSRKTRAVHAQRHPDGVDRP